MTKFFVWDKNNFVRAEGRGICTLVTLKLGFDDAVVKLALDGVPGIGGPPCCSLSSSTLLDKVEVALEIAEFRREMPSFKDFLDVGDIHVEATAVAFNLETPPPPPPLMVTMDLRDAK